MESEPIIPSACFYYTIHLESSSAWPGGCPSLCLAPLPRGLPCLKVTSREVWSGIHPIQQDCCHPAPSKGIQQESKQIKCWLGRSEVNGLFNSDPGSVRSWHKKGQPTTAWSSKYFPAPRDLWLRDFLHAIILGGIFLPRICPVSLKKNSFVYMSFIYSVWTKEQWLLGGVSSSWGHFNS